MFFSLFHQQVIIQFYLFHQDVSLCLTHFLLLIGFVLSLFLQLISFVCFFETSLLIKVVVVARLIDCILCNDQVKEGVVFFNFLALLLLLFSLFLFGSFAVVILPRQSWLERLRLRFKSLHHRSTQVQSWCHPPSESTDVNVRNSWPDLALREFPEFEIHLSYVLDKFLFKNCTFRCHSALETNEFFEQGFAPVKLDVEPLRLFDLRLVIALEVFQLNSVIQSDLSSYTLLHTQLLNLVIKGVSWVWR